MKRIFLIATLMVLINLQPTFAQAKRSMNSLPLVDPVTQCAWRYYYYQVTQLDNKREPGTVKE